MLEYVLWQGGIRRSKVWRLKVSKSSPRLIVDCLSGGEYGKLASRGSKRENKPRERGE